MEEKNKKKISYPLILMFILIIGLCGIFTFSYAFQDPPKKTAPVSLLEITMSDSGSGVIIEDTEPLTDEEMKDLEAYVFTVKNNGSRTVAYQILIEDLPLGEIEDGCKEETLLSRNQLRYELKGSKNLIALEDLDEVKLNKLVELEIGPYTEEEFELRVFVPQTAYNTAWQNKHYHYKIVIEAV